MIAEQDTISDRHQCERVIKNEIVEIYKKKEKRENFLIKISCSIRISKRFCVEGSNSAVETGNVQICYQDSRRMLFVFSMKTADFKLNPIHFNAFLLLECIALLRSIIFFEIIQDNQLIVQLLCFILLKIMRSYLFASSSKFKFYSLENFLIVLSYYLNKKGFFMSWAVKVDIRHF